jgi:carbamoyl-phosphate synthase large subunit
LRRPDESGLIVQERIFGEEYGLDVVHDLKGRFAACFVKRKLGMRAGETDAAETVDSPELVAFGRLIGERLGHIGVLDVDVMVDSSGPCLLEMNPRFGGHYPFSHEAGANIPAALIAWADGLVPDPSWLKVRSGVRCCKDISMLRVAP